MNREEINVMTNQWIAMATNDLKSHLVSLAKDANINVLSLAPLLGMTTESLESLLNGTRTPLLSEFVKIMILTGNALSIEPMADDGHIPPIPMHEEQHIPPHVPHHAPRFDNAARNVRQPSQNPIPRFGQTARPMFRPIPIMGDGNNDAPRTSAHSNTTSEHEHADTSPFESMPREQMVRIIKKKLWDSEIDTFGATREDLVKFLEKKDKQIKEYQRMEREGKSPELMKFVNGLKNLVEANPNIKDIVKNLVKDL